jgi:hypothetical protein
MIIPITTNEKLYCYKCIAKLNKFNVEIFSIVNNIVYNANNINDVHTKIDNINIDFDKWLEYNNSGNSIFHSYIWYITTKINKYQQLKPLVYAFFQKIFLNNTVNSIFTKENIEQIVNIGTRDDNKCTLLYYLVSTCENPNDNYYKKLYDLLINNGARELTSEQLNKIKISKLETNTVTEEYIPNNLREYINEITSKYKNIENIIIKTLEEEHNEYIISKCLNCNVLLDYTKEISKIMEYINKKNDNKLLHLLWSAYYQRKLLNTIFNKYYEKINNYISATSLNIIHKRHTHILDMYEESLQKLIY